MSAPPCCEHTLCDPDFIQALMGDCGRCEHKETFDPTLREMRICAKQKIHISPNFARKFQGTSLSTSKASALKEQMTLIGLNHRAATVTGRASGKLIPISGTQSFQKVARHSQRNHKQIEPHCPKSCPSDCLPFGCVHPSRVTHACANTINTRHNQQSAESGGRAF